ncbi:hypothetical protein CHU92_15100 [Flavobacterium cyanobacteriorum]|uniref:DUF4390 domain-containing protein n=1 Tax=Flavobacterium cyanobacteriorum TaxID=2022802 RepID=A0A255YRX7_9FLAO|nr:hypothetical protein CHU92_15100 [Flavobacterium cyanobacteriorum]
MKLYICLLLLVLTGTTFSQASDIADFEITFDMLTVSVKDSDFYFMSHRVVRFKKCAYTFETINKITTRVRLKGIYQYIIVPKVFFS